MWMKIVGLVLLIILNCDKYVCTNVVPRDINISRNITIYRNGYGRLLGLLSFLKGFHQAKHMYHPLILSKLWRASFEFELKPNSISEHVIPNTYFPSQFGLSNSGLGSNSIESLFHFGNNEQQSSVTIGGSNQIVKGPDQRDEVADDVSQNNRIGTVSSLDSVIPIPSNESDEKSERFVRHAIQARSDEQIEEDENVNNPNSTPTTDDTVTEAVDSTTQPLTIPQTTILTETEVSETVTTMKSETGSTISNNEQVETGSNNEQVMSVPIPSQWLGYYDYGINKPEFIKDIEFTTNYPTQLVSEDITYVKYEEPFKPSQPDYSHKYYSNFFVPLRYFKR